jgi:catechol 2,3-dioxygenase-like lactoylglutathione lyase family enzyme
MERRFLRMLSQHRSHTTIPAADIERARAWYAECLGLEPTASLPTGMAYELAGSRFVIYPTPNAGKSPNTIMGWSGRTRVTLVRFRA